MKITVKVYQNGEEVLSRVLDKGSHRAGRSEFCDIVLQGDQVSRSHMELRVTDSAVYMTNMSAGGRVKVNSERVETAEIQDGDEISIGPYKLVVFHGERDADAVPDMNAAVGDIAPPVDSPQEEIPKFNLDGDAPKEEAKPDEMMPQSPALQEPGEVIPMPLPEREFGNEDYPVEGTAALLKAETVVEAKPLVAKLVFLEGPKAGDEMPLEAYEVTFGRSKKADVFVDDEKLSRKHCKIARIGMGYRLIDLGSRNGTFVNGMRILEHPLNSFDVIEFGNTKLKFLILDLAMGDMGRNALAPVGGKTGSIGETASVMMTPEDEAALMELQRRGPSLAPEPVDFRGQVYQNVQNFQKRSGSRTPLYLLIIAALVGLYFFVQQTEKAQNQQAQTQTATKQPAAPKVPPQFPKEYAELTPESQRAIEGHYNAAIRAADQEKYEEAVANLKAIHEAIPYYKSSKELYEQYAKKYKEQQIQMAQVKAQKDEKADLALYLEDGVEYLREGDFDRAAEAFNAAILLDPKSEIAIKGLRAAELKVRDLEKLPPERDPEDEKKKQVSDLFQLAVKAFTDKEYQKAIDKAEQIRKIEIKGDTQYLNEAKQIIDRAKLMQKEEFEPFLIQAKEKYAEGDYSASRDLCEEMLKRDPAYEEAKDCVLKAKKQLNRLAKEAYTHGYILESMNRIEEAKQYWNRAKNYVRPGDDYYEKIMKKLEYYQ